MRHAPFQFSHSQVATRHPHADAGFRALDLRRARRGTKRASAVGAWMCGLPSVVCMQRGGESHRAVAGRIQASLAASAGARVVNPPGAILNSVFGPCERCLTEEAWRSNGRRVPPGGRSLSRRVVLLSTVAMLFAGQCIIGGMEDYRMVSLSPPATSLPRISLEAPLVSLDTARSALGLTTEQVLNLIDDGSLTWGFNLARFPAASRVAVRVLAQSLADFQQGRETVSASDFRAVFLLIFPQVNPPRAGIVRTIRATLVARQLSLKTCVLMRLVDAGFMGLAPNTARHSGPNGSPLVVLTSVAEFLEERRIL